MKNWRKQIAFYIPSFVASGVGFLSQTLVSGYWSSAFSEDVLHFSLNLSSYFLSLGVGAILSERVKTPTLKHLQLLAAIGGIWAGLEIPFLRICISKFGSLAVIPIICVVLSGILNGTLIPLTLRAKDRPKSMNLSWLFFVDYTAAILFSSLFTFVFLIPLGYTKTGYLISVLVIALLWVVSLLGRANIRTMGIATATGLVLCFGVHFGMNASTHTLKDAADGSELVFSRQTHYQKIVLMKERPVDKTLIQEKQYVLYLDGFLQFSTIDEQTYHACIANIPMAAVSYLGHTPKKALILGGGDGLAARNLLVSPQIEKVTNVELDPVMIEVAKTHPVLLEHNLKSFHSPRVEVVNADAFQWIKQTSDKYDLIIVDFPLPKNLALARLFSAEFYREVLNHLSEKGIMTIQAGPSFSYEDKNYMTLSSVTASVAKTIESVGGRASSYISVMDNEAFVMATHNPKFDMLDFSKRIGILGETGFGRICSYNPDWISPKVETNTLNTLTVAKYMLDWIQTGKQTTFFHYRGTRANFLPE